MVSRGTCGLAMHGQDGARHPRTARHDVLQLRGSSAAQQRQRPQQLLHGLLHGVVQKVLAPGPLRRRDGKQLAYGCADRSGLAEEGAGFLRVNA